MDVKLRQKVTAKQISEKLEINIRTVYRHIDALSASGVPIISDTGHNGGYTLLNNFIKAPLFRYRRTNCVTSCSYIC